jgi:hypothetical protein
MKLEAICSFETSVATQQTTRRHIQEDDTLHNHRCGNLKSYIIKRLVNSCSSLCHTRCAAVFMKHDRYAGLLSFRTLSIVPYTKEHSVSENESVSFLTYGRHLLWGLL